MNAPNANEVKAAREAAGLSQTDAAALVYAVPRAWQYWESGERTMNAAFYELFLLKTAQARLMKNGTVKL